MPPKKTAATGDAVANGDKPSGKFTWTPELDAKLLALCTVPRTVPVSEHEILAKRIGAPSAGSVRNRIPKVKAEHSAAWEEAGLQMPSAAGGVGAVKGASGPATPKKAAAKKRSAKAVAEEGGDDDGEEEKGKGSPMKKSKTKKVDEPEKAEVDGDGASEKEVDDEYGDDE